MRLGTAKKPFRTLPFLSLSTREDLPIHSLSASPGVQAHERMDGRAHFLELDVVASRCDPVVRTPLLAIVSDDLRDAGGVSSVVLPGVVPGVFHSGSLLGDRLHNSE